MLVFLRTDLKFRNFSTFSTYYFRGSLHSCKMDTAQYSRIEGGKTDPSFTTINKIANALNVSLSELFRADEIFDDVNTYDKTLIEKLQHLDSLNEDEKKSIYTLIDSLITKKKLKDNLQNLANL